MEEMLKEMRDAFEGIKERMEKQKISDEAYARGRIDSYNEILLTLKTFSSNLRKP